ncbi:hypothetical protein [Streptomyces sp. NBC_01006]|uniref:hypothetical protein n=1 Tax=Streptomyces sp. NBC_01006 TaxID=2903716 RepID=UPI003863D536|nr:hypothetical protein OG509_02120 [Streptomyces sp. NBC_01006]
MARTTATTRFLLYTASAALAVSPVALAQAAPATQQGAQSTTTACSPQEGMATGTGWIHGNNGKVPNNELAMGQGCLTTTTSGGTATLTFKVRANAATRENKDSPWVPAKNFHGSANCKLYRVDKNGHFSLKDKDVTRNFQDASGPVDACELTAKYPTSELRNLKLRWGLSTGVRSSAYVTKDINLYEVSWYFGRDAAATPTAAAEVGNSIYPLW